MKLKEIDRTAMQAWSPAQQHPIYLATGEFFGKHVLADLGLCVVAAMKGPLLEVVGTTPCPEGWSGVYVMVL